MRTLTQDLRNGFRTLLRSPSFAAVALIALAVGIGANTAIFSVLNAVILRPLPYQDPGRLVMVRELIPKVGPNPIPLSAADVVDFAHQNRVFDGVAGFEGLTFELSGGDQPERVDAARVNAALFPTLGVAPLLGRTFTSEEDQPGRRVAVLSYGLWQRRFGADPDVVGKTVSLDRMGYTIIGVMPRSFAFPIQGLSFFRPASLWVPMAFSSEELKNRGDNFNIGVVARLKPGVTLARATADAAAIAHGIQETYPAEVRGDLTLGAVVTPLDEVVVGDVRTLLLILAGAVGFVLLIACANVANLLLTRSAERRKEIAIRAALGAGRLRLLRQFLTESLMLALAGGALGLLVAKWGTDILVALAPASIPRAQESSLDLPVLGFTLALSLLTGLIFGTVPAWTASRTHLAETLKEGGRESTGAPHRRLRGALVVSEVALALVLLISAGLLIKSFVRCRETDPGFQPERLMTMSLALPDSTYKQATQIRSFYRQLIDRTQALPGVKAAGASTDLPLEGAWTRIFTVEGYHPPPGEQLNMCSHSMILGGYLQALGVPLIRGRIFTDQDRPGSVPVIVVSKSIADRFWPNQDPIGKRLKWGLPQSSDPWLTVVGVVGDVKQAGLDQPTRPHTYEPWAQADDSMVQFASALNLAVRATADPVALAGMVRSQVWSLDKQLAVADVKTMDQVVQESMAPRRFNMFLLAVFAIVSVFLAAIGIYGVISYSVAQRTHEIGVRMALGARRSDVLGLVVREGMASALIGVALGLIGALAITRLMSSLLYAVRPTDPVTFVGVAVLAAAVALLASYIPARRATKLDPMVALRYE